LNNKPAHTAASAGSSTSSGRQKQLGLEDEFEEWAQEKIEKWQPIDPLGSEAEENNPVAFPAEPTSINPPQWSAADFESPEADIELERSPSVAEPRPPRTSIAATVDSRGDSPRRARIMQVLDCYLVLESDKGLVIVDQHALHERVLYEQFRGRVLSGKVESQKLLVPQTVEMSLKETALLLSHRELLSELGFGVEEFGHGTVLLTAYPALLPKADHVKLLRDVVDQLDQPGRAPTRRDLLEQLLSMMACKAAIKAGHRLSVEEMESLLAYRHLIEDSHHCPHGRPTALVLSREALDRQFGRLG
jgi:DNA mismatch repair protein MutL